MTAMTDQEFTGLPPDKQIEYAAEAGRVFGEDMTEEQLATVVDLHGKVSKLGPAEREAFISGLAWDTLQRDRELGGH
jgi:hypothetical protein